MPEKERFGKVIEQSLNVKGGLALAGVPVTPTAAELNTLHGATTTAAQLATLSAAAGTVTFARLVKVARVALAPVDTAGGVFSWANPEASAIIIQRVTLDITTPATGACTLDVGTTAVTATTLSDTLIDGLDVHTAAVTADNLSAPGTNGLMLAKIAAGKWVTGSTASGASAGIVGFVYIAYVMV